MATKKVPAKKSAASTAAPAPAKRKPRHPVIEKRLNASGLIGFLADYSELSRAQVKAVIEGIEVAMAQSMSPGGCGEFVLPGVCRLKTREVAAVKGGQKMMNPFTKEMMITKARPASRRAKALPHNSVKLAVAGDYF